MTTKFTKQYTFDEAVDTVLCLKEKLNVMPDNEDYTKYSDIVDLDGLVEALGVKESMKRNNTRAYAAVNIAVLRAERKREGRQVFIARDDSFNTGRRAL